MADYRRRDEWGRMSSLMALLFNCHRAEDVREATPDDFNPMLQEKKPDKLPKVSIGALKSVFVDKQIPKEMQL